MTGVSTAAPALGSFDTAEVEVAQGEGASPYLNLRAGVRPRLSVRRVEGDDQGVVAGRGGPTREDDLPSGARCRPDPRNCRGDVGAGEARDSRPGQEGVVEPKLDRVIA